jgi:hypothetical protein
MNTEEKKQKGLYTKYNVSRTDGSSEPGGKHEKCRYFVLDLDCDPLAIPGAIAYAIAARKEGYEVLADDLIQVAEELRQKLGLPERVAHEGLSKMRTSGGATP